MKTIFVGSGGNLKATTFFAGFCKQMADAGIHPDIIVDCSGSAPVGYHLERVSADEAYNIVRNIGTRSRWLNFNWRRLFIDGLFDSEPAARNMESLQKTISKSPTAYHVYCDLLDGRVYLQQGLGACLASIAEPPVMRPVKRSLVDGGIRSQTPVKEALRKFSGANYRFYIAVANPIKLNPDPIKSAPRTWFGVMMRSVSIMIHNVFHDDLTDIRDERVIKIFAPEKRIPITAFSFRQSNLDKGLNAGKDAVKKWFTERGDKTPE